MVTLLKLCSVVHRGLTVFPSLTKMTLHGKIGLIADVQFVDQEDGFDFTGVQRRRYSNSLKVLERAVEEWNKDENIVLIAQLGDIIDVKNCAGEGRRDGEVSDEALTKVQKVLANCVCTDIVNVIGNHELYNFSRSRLNSLLNVSRGGDTTWYSFLPVHGSKVRLVVLDSYEVSTIQGCNHTNTQTAFDFLRQHNPNDITK